MSFTKTVFIIKDVQSPKHSCNNYWKRTPQEFFQSVGLLHQIRFEDLKRETSLCFILYSTMFQFLTSRTVWNYSICNCVFCCFTNHAFLAKETLIKLIVIYVQYLLSHNICKKCNAEHLSNQHLPPHILIYSFSWQWTSFFYSKRIAISAISSTGISTRQHFLHPILNTATSHLSSRTHLPSVTMTSERPSVGGETIR